MNEASFWNWLEVSQLSRHCLCETTIYKWKLILNILSCPPYSAIRAVLVCRSLEFMTVRRSPKACSRDWKSPRESSEWDCSLHNLEMQIQQNVAKSRRVTRYYESQLERATSHGTLRLKWTRPRKSSWASSRRWWFVSSSLLSSESTTDGLLTPLEMDLPKHEEWVRLLTTEPSYENVITQLRKHRAHTRYFKSQISLQLLIALTLKLLFKSLFTSQFTNETNGSHSVTADPKFEECTASWASCQRSWVF